MEGGNDKSTLKPEIPKVVSCRFPATRLLRAQYSSLVHDRASQPLSARSLEKALAETEADVNGVISVPMVPPILRDTQNPTPSLEQAPLPWPTKLKVLRERLSLEIESLQTSLYLQQQQLQMALPAIQALLQAASQSAAHTAAILNKASFTGTHLEGYRTRGRMDCGQRGCKAQALPFSRFCLNHISSDSEQVLYRKCSVVTTELLIQCNQAVQDILSEESMCTQHYKGMSTDKTHGKKRTPGKTKPKASPSTRAKKGGSKHGGRSGPRVKAAPQQRGTGVPHAAVHAPPSFPLGTANSSPKTSGGVTSIPALLQFGLGTQPTAVTPTRRSMGVDGGGWEDSEDLLLPSKHPRIGSLSEEQVVTNSFSHNEPQAVDSPLALTPATAFPPPLSPLHLLPPGPVLGNIMSGESSSASDGDL